MNIESLYQNKNNFFILFITVFILFIVLYFMADYLGAFAYFIWPALLFLIFFSGIIYGLVTKDKFRASFLGFIFPMVFGLLYISTASPLSDFAREYPEYYYFQLSYLFSYVSVGILLVIASLFASSNDLRLSQKIWYYLAACIFLNAAFYLFLMQPSSFALSFFGL